MNKNVKFKIFISSHNEADVKSILSKNRRWLRLYLDLLGDYEIQHESQFSMIIWQVDFLSVRRFFRFSQFESISYIFDESQIILLGVALGELSPPLDLLLNQPRIWLDRSVSISEWLSEYLEEALGSPEKIDSNWFAWPLTSREIEVRALSTQLKMLYDSDHSAKLYDSVTLLNMNVLPIGSPQSPSLSESGRQVPLRIRAKSLPHDGLFVRRNNAFGTKLAGGIKEMLDQGVMIEQINIRFDDFVASDTTQVPLPAAGSAIAVSHGISKVDPNHRYHQDTTHYLEIALRAADSAPEAHPKQQPIAVNYVFVVDISGSMAGEKLDFVKVSIRELFWQMRDEDIIGIVAFSSKVKTVVKATPKGQLDPGDFSAKLSSLRTEDSTDINLGLQYGIAEIQRHQHTNMINQLYLFSDGNPNSGEQSWVKIRQNVAVRVRGDINLSAFGFGTDVNTRELDALAGVTGGQYTFVIRPDDVKLTLQNDLLRREHLAAMNIQAQIEIAKDISILHFYGHDQITDPARRDAVLREVEVAKQAAEEQLGIEPQPDLVTEEKGIRIFAPDLAVGETYWIVFELGVPSDRADQSIGTATTQYVDTFSRENKRNEIDLSMNGTIPSDVVLLHGLGLWTSEVTFYALDDLYQNDYDTASKRINEHIKIMEVAARSVSYPLLIDDITSLRKFNSLAMNLGQLVSFSEDSRNYAVFALSAFGQVRNGITRV